MAKFMTLVESTVGPRADGYEGSDFTLLFEEIVFAISPTAMALLLLPFFLSRILMKQGKVANSWQLPAKLIVRKRGICTLGCRKLTLP